MYAIERRRKKNETEPEYENRLWRVERDRLAQEVNTEPFSGFSVIGWAAFILGFFGLLCVLIFGTQVQFVKELGYLTSLSISLGLCAFGFLFIQQGEISEMKQLLRQYQKERKYMQIYHVSPYVVNKIEEKKETP